VPVLDRLLDGDPAIRNTPRQVPRGRVLRRAKL
jgi:hypothetical protein